MSNLKLIMRHIFSKKSITIRVITFICVITCSWFWIGDPIKSVGLSVSVLVGSMIIQGILEWMYD